MEMKKGKALIPGSVYGRKAFGSRAPGRERAGTGAGPFSHRFSSGLSGGGAEADPNGYAGGGLSDRGGVPDRESTPNDGLLCGGGGGEPSACEASEVREGMVYPGYEFHQRNLCERETGQGLRAASACSGG